MHWSIRSRCQRILFCGCELATAILTSKQESVSNTIKLEDDDLYIVERMISFMYFNTYSDQDPEPEEGPSSRSLLRTHAEVYAIADKYDLLELSELARAKYSSALTWECDPAAFLESIPKVYNLTPDSNRGLRDVVLRYARQHAEELREDEELMSLFESVAHSVPGFAAELLVQYMDAPIMGRCHDCGPHQKVQVLQLRCKNCGKGGASLEN